MSPLAALLQSAVDGRPLAPGLPRGRVRLVVLGVDDIGLSLVDPVCSVAPARPEDPPYDLTLWLSPAQAETLVTQGSDGTPLRASGNTELLRTLANIAAPTRSPLGTRLGS